MSAVVQSKKAVAFGLGLPRLTVRTVLLWGLVLLVGLLTVYPTLLILLNSFQVGRPGEPVVLSLENWRVAFRDPGLMQAILNTFILAGIRIVLVTGAAIFFAWVITRTDTPMKSFIEFMLWLGFFLPQLPMVMGWILLLDPDFGIVNMGLKQAFGLQDAPFNLYSYGGIIWAHMAYGTSIRFLLITPAFRAMDASLEEAAKMSGASGFGTIWRITVPILAPAIIAAVVLGLVKALQSFETELLLGFPSGIQVYSTKMYDYIRFEPPLYGPATAMSSIFLVAIFALVWMQRVLLGRRQYTTVTGKSFSTRPTSLGPWRWVTFGICIGWVLLFIVLPFSFLLLGTFMRLFGFWEMKDVWTPMHWQAAFTDPIFVRSLGNTLTLGVASAIVGAMITAVIGYVLVRVQFTGRSALDFMSWLPWALPGTLLSLALLWLFVGNPVLRVLYGTVAVLVVAIVVSELPLGTQVLKASTMQLSKELEESAWMSGATWFYSFRRVILPILKPAVLAVGLIIFISAVREIPTVVFLASSESRTLSLLMVDYAAGAQMERAVVLGVFITFVIVVAALIGRFALGIRMGPGR